VNQALSASSENRSGQSANTLANIGQRVPVPEYALRDFGDGVRGQLLVQRLETSLNKTLEPGVQFLAPTLTRKRWIPMAQTRRNSCVKWTSVGDQNSPRQRWGRTSFDRYMICFWRNMEPPQPSARLQHMLLGGWDVASVVTIQSGSALTISYTNAATFSE